DIEHQQDELGQQHQHDGVVGAALDGSDDAGHGQGRNRVGTAGQKPCAAGENMALPEDARESATGALAMRDASAHVNPRRSILVWKFQRSMRGRGKSLYRLPNGPRLPRVEEPRSRDQNVSLRLRTLSDWTSSDAVGVAPWRGIKVSSVLRPGRSVTALSEK